MALTLPQLQANLDTINEAIGNSVMRVRYPDGREVTYRAMHELLAAKDDIEDQIRTFGNTSASKSTLGQTRRGDGPPGPGFPGCPWWDVW
jgi:hypothetical protein